ncbi:MAG: peptidoglycan-binding protein, partial [Gammaproteobacteria bacterium]|nr:peptidoglycan-binding protein [Gammaproteobacteria bacterium]
QKAYVRRIDDSSHLKYEILRGGQEYKDGDTGEILGYDAEYIGSSELQRTGDPATVFINSTEREVIIGDRLIAASEERATANFTPHAPAMPTEGNIISVFGGVNQIGQYNVVVLDRGRRDGLEPGTVLRIDQRGETVRDVVTPDSRDTVKLPDEEAGLLMVFRSFDRVSFGLVMHATRVMHIGDKVRNP